MVVGDYLTRSQHFNDAEGNIADTGMAVQGQKKNINGPIPEIFKLIERWASTTEKMYDLVFRKQAVNGHHQNGHHHVR